MRSRSPRARWAWSLADVPVARPTLELTSADWAEYLRIGGLPDGLLRGVDERAFRVLAAQVERGERGDGDHLRPRR